MKSERLEQIHYFYSVNNLPYKQLIKTALITAPMIAVIYCTPMYIFRVVDLSYFIMLPAFTIPILISWFLNLLFLAFVRGEWIKTLLRTLVISVIMFLISGIIIQIIKPPVHLNDSYIMLVRIVNIVTVNAIIYVLIDLTLTKENKNRIELENANLKIVTLEAEYKLLKDQINPHFLFNALSTAKSLIRPQPQIAEEYIIRLSDFLRVSMNNNKKTVTLKEEIQLCKDFISLNQIRFGNALQISYQLGPENSQVYVPYFAILSLIENAIKHNSLTLESPLRIQVIREGDTIIVSNNKTPKFIMESQSKTGLNNLRERYKLISGKEIILKETDTEFTVQIPLLPQ